MNTTVHCTIMVIFITKILTKRTFLILCNMNGVSYKLVNTLIFCCRYRNYGNAKQGFHLIDIYRAKIADYLVHHIEREHHRHVHLQKLLLRIV